MKYLNTSDIVVVKNTITVICYKNKDNMISVDSICKAAKIDVCIVEKILSLLDSQNYIRYNKIQKTVLSNF